MKIRSYIYSVMASVLLAFSACSPDEFDLGAKSVTTDDLVEGIAYTITHDSKNPNIIYLESKLGDNYIALWEHPQGRSQAKKVTLKMPFDGTYNVTFGVETRGGIVYGEPTTFTVNDFCAEFVTDKLWTLLTGGVGALKTWIHDNGKYGLAAGEISYADPSTVVEWNNWTPNWDPAAGITLAEGESATLWESAMTFDLVNGANVAVNDRSANGVGEQKGTFMLDTDAHTITFTDAELLHTAGWTKMTSNWRKNLKILNLTENQLRIGILREKDTSGEDPWWIIWNFVSKEYADNYKAPAQDVYPVLAADWRDYVEPKTNKVITYKLSDDTPFDWCNFDGSVKGIKNVPALAGVEDVTLVLNSGTSEYSFTDINGKEYKGKYKLNNEGVYTFDGALPEIKLSANGRAILKTNTDHTLRIMSYETSDYTGGLTDLWLGSKEIDDQGSLYQYMGYHFVAQVAGAGKSYKGALNLFDTDWVAMQGDAVFVTGDGDYIFTINGACSKPYGIYLDVAKLFKDNPNCDMTVKSIKVDGNSVAFDDTAIDRGTADDDKSTARRYLLNPWGATAADGSKYVFSSSLEVTVNIQFDCGYPALNPEK